MKLVVAAAALAIVGCGTNAGTPESTGTAQQQLIGEQATGSVPSGLPARFMLGLNEGRAGTWMSESGVPWDMRYQYLSKDWVTNWNHGDHDGQYALDFFYDSYDRGILPAVQFYQIVEEQPAGENTMLTKMQTPETMASYFNDFKILMQRVKEYGGPVAVMVEADGYGFAQIQSGDDPGKYAAIADSGLPELAELPNTVAGWGLAFLQLKKAVGADNALLGVHVSTWATNFDVMMNNDITDLETEVDVGYWFLSQLGLTENQTGLTYDFLVGDPSDRDADYYARVLNQQRWWDDDDGASIAERSFNRFAEWLRLWNVKSGKRWILWQVPLGNSNHLNVENQGGARQGYKDNRPEYFLGDGSAHIQKFADAGVIALLFGAGMNGMSTFDNDVYSDGQLFMKSRAQAIYDEGGLDIAPGLDWKETTTGPRPREEEEGDPVDSVDGDITAQYRWETPGLAELQGWSFDGAPVSGLEAVADRAHEGSGSLAVRLSGEAGKARIFLRNPAIETGTPYVVFRVWLPEGHTLESIQPFVMEGAAKDYAWTSNWRDAAEVEPGRWTTLFVRIPANASAPFAETGIELEVNAGAPTTLYFDSVGWPDTPEAPGQSGTGAPGSGGGSAAPGAAYEEQPLRSHASGCTIGGTAPSGSRYASLLVLGAFGWWLRRRRVA